MLSNQEKVPPYDYQRTLLTASVMRNSRLRTFIYVLVVGGMCCTIYMLSATHTQLKDVESAHDKCLQQRDSLSAQLQVVYEHKNRLEKSLQQEKVDHKLTREENDKQKNEIHVRVEREKHNLESRYNNLLQEHETLKSEQQQLNDEIASLKESLSLLEKEKKQLVAALSAQLDTLKQQKDEENGKLTDHINHLLQEKDDLQKKNEILAARSLSRENELHLCHIQFQQLEGKFNHLQSQIDEKLSEKIPDDPVAKLNRQKIEDKREKEQIPNHKNNDLNQGAKEDEDRNIAEDEDGEKKEEKIPNKSLMNDDHDDTNQAGHPNLLPRPNLVLDVKNENKQVKNNIAGQSHQYEEHLNPKVLEKPAVHDSVNYKSKVHPIGGGNNLIDSKAVHSPEGLNPSHNAKPMDLLHNEEHLPQVQPPHSFDKIGAAGDGADPDQWDKYHQGGVQRDPFQSKLEINNHVLPQPFNIKEPSSQNAKQQGAEDGQEHGVLIKPPLQGNWAHKVGQNIEGLKRGPQMIDEKNGHRRQQEEDGDYGEDGDDDNADDQDAEANEEEQLMVGDHAHGKVFQDADFDDQDNAEQDDRNVRNQEKEEGVMVAPK